MDIKQPAGTTMGNDEGEFLPPSLISDTSYIQKFQRKARAVAKLDLLSSP